MLRVFHCLLDNNYHELTSEIKLNFSNGGAMQLQHLLISRKVSEAIITKLSTS